MYSRFTLFFLLHSLSPSLLSLRLHILHSLIHNDSSKTQCSEHSLDEDDESSLTGPMDGWGWMDERTDSLLFNRHLPPLPSINDARSRPALTTTYPAPSCRLCLFVADPDRRHSPHCHPQVLVRNQKFQERSSRAGSIVPSPVTDSTCSFMNIT